jgi:hypothetical protein
MSISENVEFVVVLLEHTNHAQIGFVHLHRGMFGHLSWQAGTHLPVKKGLTSKDNYPKR